MTGREREEPPPRLTPFEALGWLIAHSEPGELWRPERARDESLRTLTARDRGRLPRARDGRRE